MPPKGRGRGGSHKGGRRRFTTQEEVAAQQEKEEKERQWRERKNRGGDESGSDGDESSSNDGSDESSSGEEVEVKKKGVEGLIEIENPNRAPPKARKGDKGPGTEKDSVAAPQLSRREREELERQQAKAHYDKLHAAGKTEEARADLARLAIIRKQREEQARKKAEEKRLAEEKAAAAAKR